MRTLPRVLGALLLPCVAGSLSAREFEPRVTASAIYSDNATRSNTEQVSDTALNTLLGLRVLQEGSRFSIDADVAAVHREYVNDRLDSETLPSGYLNALATLVPEKLTWSIADNLGQISSEPFDALSSEDRQNANFFSTGPDLLLPFAGRNRFELRMRYGLTNYERAVIDDSRYGGEAGVGRVLSGGSIISAVYGYEKVDYDLEILPSIERDQAFLRYAVQSSRTALVAELGTESAKMQGGDKDNNEHVLLGVQRRLTRRLSFNAEYRHGFSDAAESFRADLQDNFTAGADQDVQTVAGPFSTDEAYLMLVRSAGRTLLAWEAVYNEDDYRNSSVLDRRVTGTDLIADYRLSSRVTLALRGRWAKEKFVNTGLENTRTEASVGLNKQLSRSLQVLAAYRRSRGAGDLPEDHFSENRVTLSINYAAEGSRARLFDEEANFRFYQRPQRDVTEESDSNDERP
jgi:Putative beta-barrel porin 2